MLVFWMGPGNEATAMVSQSVSKIETVHRLVIVTQQSHWSTTSKNCIPLHHKPNIVEWIKLKVYTYHFLPQCLELE